MKKLRPPTILPFKTDKIKVGLVFSISNFFNSKASLENKCMRKKIPFCSNSALEAEQERSCVLLQSVKNRKYRSCNVQFKGFPHNPEFRIPRWALINNPSEF